jgi:hypothetical protein
MKRQNTKTPYSLRCCGLTLGLMLPLLGCHVVAVSAQDIAAEGQEETMAAANEVALTTPLVMKQLLRGSLSVDEAWQRGLLKVDNLFYIFSNYIDPWGTFEGKPAVELRHELAGLLVRYGADRLKDLKKIPPQVRLWIADYYQSVSDERAVNLAESVLTELEGTPILDENPLEFQLLERIAWYYHGIGDYKKEGQIWARVNARSKEHTWQKYDALFQEIASRYHADPSDDSNLEFLKRSLQNSDDFMVQSALSAVVTMMLTQGRIDQALKLLNTNSISDNPHSATRVLASGLKGKVALLQGETDLAKTIWQETTDMIESYQLSPDKLHLSLDLLQSGAETLELFQDSAFLVQQKFMQLQPDQQPAGIIEVISLRQGELAVSTSQKGVRIVQGEWYLRMGATSYVKKMEVYLDAGITPEHFVIFVQDKTTGKVQDVAVYVLQAIDASPSGNDDLW